MVVAGLSLLDAIGNLPATAGGEAPEELQVRMANELVAACLDDYRHIEALDVCGRNKTWRRLYLPETEAQMRQLHEQWLAPARDLFERVRGMRSAGHEINRFDELMDAVGLTQALLLTTVEDLQQAREQYRKGEWSTLEEVRRELRAAAGQ